MKKVKVLKYLKGIEKEQEKESDTMKRVYGASVTNLREWNTLESKKELLKVILKEFEENDFK